MIYTENTEAQRSTEMIVVADFAELSVLLR